MSDQWAREIRVRLVAHWPALGGDENDPAAKLRLEDWLRVIKRSSEPVAREAMAALLLTHDRFPPSMGEWQEACRSAAQRQSVALQQIERETAERKALEAGADDGTRGRVAALIASTRDQLANVDRHPEIDAPRPVSKYDGAGRGRILGDKHMTVEEHDEEAAAFAARARRTKARRRARGAA